MIADEMEAGTLSVLNVGAGDMRFSFNSDDPQEVERAKRVVRDMLARGYILFVEVEGKLKRVRRFENKNCAYVIADGPEVAPSPHEPERVQEAKPKLADRRMGKRGVREREVSAGKHRAHGVAPTGGG